MQKRAFIIHCWEGKPNTRWYPWLKSELQKRGFRAYVPAMPNTNHPRNGPWLKHLAKVVGKPDKGCYFIGHSVGCINIMRYLESLKPGQKVGGVVFVAGYTTDLSYDDLKTFFAKPINYEKIKSHCSKFVAIHSDNDPYVSLHYGTDILRNKLGARLIIEHNKGHFSLNPLTTKLPSALSAVLKMPSS